VSGPERFSASGVAPDDGSAAIGLIAGTATIKLVTPDVRAPSRSWSLSFDPQQTAGVWLGDVIFVPSPAPTRYFVSAKYVWSMRLVCTDSVCGTLHLLKYR
jgi:hypothetical protein